MAKAHARSATAVGTLGLRCNTVRLPWVKAQADPHRVFISGQRRGVFGLIKRAAKLAGCIRYQRGFPRRIPIPSRGSPWFLGRLFQGAHDVLPRDHAFQLTLTIDHRKAPGLDAQHELQNPR